MIHYLLATFLIIVVLIQIALLLPQSLPEARRKTIKSRIHWLCLAVALVAPLMRLIPPVIDALHITTLSEKLEHEQKFWVTIGSSAENGEDIMHMPDQNLWIALGDIPTEYTRTDTIPSDWIYRLTFTNEYTGSRKAPSDVTPIPSTAEPYIMYIGEDYTQYGDRFVEMDGENLMIGDIALTVNSRRNADDSVKFPMWYD